MTDRPILFSAPMVRALLDGSKTQTRRILKKPTWAQDKGWPENIMNEMDLSGRLVWHDKNTGCAAALPTAKPSDRLWVKETWRTEIRYDNLAPRCLIDHGAPIQYGADEPISDAFASLAGKTRVSIHMPRWASRLTLTVTDVRVERLQDISENDCIAEGIEALRIEQDVPIWKNYLNDASLLSGGGLMQPSASFLSLWNSINGPDAWDQNPWVVAYTFTVEKRNIDQCA